MKQEELFFTEGYILMSNYPIWWDTTVTVYNRYEDSQTQIVTWFRTVVPGCFWKYAGDKVAVGTVVLDTKSVLCRIRKSQQFMEKYQWQQLPNDEMSDYFTIGLGDIMVKGEVLDEIDEYTSGRRSTDLLEKYRNLQGCMEVEDFSINTGIGRNNEHYLVRGK